MLDSDKFFVSIALPIYNEETILEKNVNRLVDSLNGLNIDYEIVIFDDGSDDDSHTIANKIAGINNTVSVIHSNNRIGKGASLKESFRHCKGSYLGFMDVDIPFSLSVLGTIREMMIEGYDAIIGSRYVGDTRVEQPLSRKTLSLVYNFYVRLLFGSTILDHQCGLKFFRSESVRDVLNEVQSRGFVFDTELLVRLQRRRLNIIEIPVDWVEPKGRRSRFRVFRDGFNMWLELTRFWLRS